MLGAPLPLAGGAIAYGARRRRGIGSRLPLPLAGEGRGGYYGKPGPVVMLQGWLEFQAMKRGAHLMLPPRDNQSDV
ncbi:hypothetical protein DCM80_14910 [Bradyrhizobium sp. WBOS08]|nr:hypothetical protein DCM80_14910 [Bradyrhizobium sp. WBOS08]